MPGLWWRPSYHGDGAGPGSRGTLPPTPHPHPGGQGLCQMAWAPWLLPRPLRGHHMDRGKRQDVWDQILILPLAHWETPGKHVHRWPFWACLLPQLKQKLSNREGALVSVKAWPGPEPGQPVSSHPHVCWKSPRGHVPNGGAIFRAPSQGQRCLEAPSAGPHIFARICHRNGPLAIQE